MRFVRPGWRTVSSPSLPSSSSSQATAISKSGTQQYMAACTDAAAVGVTVFALWIHLDFAPLAFGGAGGFDPRTQYGSIDWALAATRLLGAIVIVPVMEELFWRSFVLRWTANPDFLKVVPMESGGKALALSALLFGLEHHLWFAGLAAGVTYGWLYMATGKLWTSIAAHATTNTALGVWVLVTGSWRLW